MIFYNWVQLKPKITAATGQNSFPIKQVHNYELERINLTKAPKSACATSNNKVHAKLGDKTRINAAAARAELTN